MASGLPISQPGFSDRAADRRYDRASILLHWTIAVLILVQIGLGWWMNEVLPDHSPAQAQVLGVHMSLGLTILLLTLVRIANRLIQPAPPLPADMALWERILARGTHVVFYLLLLVLPLTGWAIASMGKHSISFWGLPWPHLPGVGLVFGSPTPHATREALAHVHVYILIWIVFITLALHVAGALWHQWFGSPVLWRMTWLRAPTSAHPVDADEEPPCRSLNTDCMDIALRPARWNTWSQAGRAKRNRAPIKAMSSPGTAPRFRRARAMAWRCSTRLRKS